MDFALALLLPLSLFFLSRKSLLISFVLLLLLFLSSTRTLFTNVINLDNKARLIRDRLNWEARWPMDSESCPWLMSCTHVHRISYDLIFSCACSIRLIFQKRLYSPKIISFSPNDDHYLSVKHNITFAWRFWLAVRDSRYLVRGENSVEIASDLATVIEDLFLPSPILGTKRSIDLSKITKRTDDDGKSMKK